MTDTNKAHLLLVVEDDEALHGVLDVGLSDHGFELHAGTNAWDAPRMFVRDPAGHRVEVMSKPPHPPWPAAPG